MPEKKQTKSGGLKSKQVREERNLGSADLNIKRAVKADGIDEAKQALGAQINELERKNGQLRQALEQKDQEFKRALADYHNVLERSQREISQAQTYGLQAFAKELLPTMDSFEQALLTCKNGQATQESIHEGIELTFGMMTKALARFSIVEIQPEGKPFNPDLHEAISAQESDKFAPNTVIQVIQKGYKIKDRLLRPALVIVAKESA